LSDAPGERPAGAKEACAAAAVLKRLPFLEGGAYPSKDIYAHKRRPRRPKPQSLGGGVSRPGISNPDTAPRKNKTPRRGLVILGFLGSLGSAFFCMKSLALNKQNMRHCPEK